MFESLKQNTYPGRGILLGSIDGKTVIAYFIMGRSVNSRNRVFVMDGDGIRTQAKDPAKLTDPSLIIYAPVRVLGDVTVVTNGDQTDTIFDALNGNGTFESALRQREYEPDAPNFTPRISGVADKDGYKLSILKHFEGTCIRQFFEYGFVDEIGHLIHTYKSDGEPIPSFSGEPEALKICGDAESFTEELWNSLDKDNKVALFVRFTDRKTGDTQTKIINR